MLKVEHKRLVHSGHASMFDLNQLRCFVTVAEELHFGRAATRLNMTQPPLSRQIQVLEHIIDAPLLERTSRSVKIGFTAAAAYGFLPDLIAACRTRFPEVDLSLKEMVSGDQLEALASGQIDAGLLRPPIARPDLATRRVVAEPLLAAIPARHRLAEVETISIRDFSDEPFVMYSPYESRYFYDLLVAQFSRADILPRYVQHLSQIHSILAMVRAGLGVSIVPAAAASLTIADVKLRPLKLRVPKPVELFLVWRRDQENPLLPALIEIAGELALATGAQQLDED